ncbi:MAG: hypothetical protein WD708_06565 [Kiritimatiellia bacterium]
MTSESESFQYGPYTVEASSLSKVLFPKAGITKRDFIRYAEDISGFMLPHLKSRPLSFERYPDGVGAEGFFQKHTPDYVPDWIRTRQLQKDGGTVEHTLFFLDTNRNAYGQTAVAPYAVRSAENAPIACPVEWEEALAKGARSDQYTLKTIRKRLERKGDVWSTIRRHAATLAPRRDNLNAG